MLVILMCNCSFLNFLRYQVRYLWSMLIEGIIWTIKVFLVQIYLRMNPCNCYCYLNREMSSENLQARFRGASFGLLGVFIPFLMMTTYLISSQQKIMKDVLGEDILDTLGIYLVRFYFIHLRYLKKWLNAIICSPSTTFKQFLVVIPDKFLT